jgi:uncharacterized membrane protein
MKIQLPFAKFIFAITKVTKRIWFSAFLYALLGVITAFIALFVRGIIPEEISTKIGVDAVSNILTILASSMLAVATFSLSIMVTAFGHVSSSASPRATSLIIENQSAQRAVATFIGTFLYSIVAIIALATQSYGPEGRFVLFLVTIIVIVVIVVTLIKWVDQLSTLGQVGSTIAEIESATLLAIKERSEAPFLGGRPLENENFSSASDLTLVTSEKVGFVVFIDTQAIQKICEEQDFKIILSVLPGSFIYPDRALASVNKNIDPKCLEAIASQFVIEKNRNFKQDPQFGFLLLAEVASRALSIGTNDTGTALDVITSASRLFKMRIDLDRKTKGKAPLYSRIFVPHLRSEDLLGTLFAPIARDGSAMFEVGIRIQKTLRTLKNYDEDYRIGCDFYADFTEKHFNMSLKTQYEKDLVADAWLSNK